MVNEGCSAYCFFNSNLHYFINKMDKIPKYSFWQRLKYTYKRKWFCKSYFLGMRYSSIATHKDIFVDYIWRDIQQKKKKKS